MPELQYPVDLSAIPAPKRELLDRVSRQAAEVGMLLYLAGGVVRDLLLRHPIQDLDVVIEGDAIRLARQLVRRLGGKVTTHLKFGTATWQLPMHDGKVESLDLATARTESYEFPGALPQVEFSSIRQDLGRRDFSINAMALRLEAGEAGTILDPFGGQGDLKKGVIRILHPNSFMDDPTRMFRAVRYALRYDFTIAAETHHLMNALARQVLSTLSGERLRHELDLMLDERHAAEMLADADKLKLLSSIHRGLHKPGAEFARLHNAIPDPRLGIPDDRRSLGYLLWLSGLTPDDLNAIRNRLDFSGGLTKFLMAAAVLRHELPNLRGASPSQWTQRLDKVPPMVIYALFLHTEEPALATYLVRWRYVQATINGDKLKRRGLVPGPFFKKTLLRLRAAWLDGEVNSAKEEEALLERILRE